LLTSKQVADEMPMAALATNGKEHLRGRVHVPDANRRAAAWQWSGCPAAVGAVSLMIIVMS
jgi:hypothetical protein